MRTPLLILAAITSVGTLALVLSHRAPLPAPPQPVAHVAKTHIHPGMSLVTDYAVPVLMYHRVNDLTPREARSPLMRDLTVPTADFEDQVRYLKDNGFTFLFAREVEDALRNGTSLPEKSICITMDDGYRDNFERAFPILQKYGACATIFVVTRAVTTDNHLTWGQLALMRDQDTDYGSHSVTHPDLTTLSSDTLDFELRASKSELEHRLAMPISSIAYPSGAYNDTVVERARIAGYLAGWKKGGGPVVPGDDPMLLPRVRVHGRTTEDDFNKAVWSGVYVRQEHAG